MARSCVLACVCACICLLVYVCCSDRRSKALLRMIDRLALHNMHCAFCKVSCLSSCFTATTSSSFSTVLGDDTVCSVATACNVLACI